jgi:hypothetical protein
MTAPSRESQRLALRRFCRQAANAARRKIQPVFSDSPPKAFDRGYYLGQAQAYEMLLKHKLRKS